MNAAKPNEQLLACRLCRRGVAVTNTSPALKGEADLNFVWVRAVDRAEGPRRSRRGWRIGDQADLG
jgi:hypothetical protein